MTDKQLNIELTRRRFLAGSAMAGFAAFLAACGTSGQGTTKPSTGGGATTPPATAGATAAATEAATQAPAATGGGKLNFANWIGYIDVDDDNTTHPTLDKFTEETGIEVDYQEAVDDNETFFTSDLQSTLKEDLPSGWDLIVVTDWMVARLVRLGWLETINVANTPNFPANLLDQYKGRSFDPDTNLAAPWQSGMTGIGFDQKKTGPLDSLAVFWDPQYKGKMTYLTEMRDTVGLAAIKLGYEPETLTQEQFDASIAEIKKAVDAKIVRQLQGNSYVDSMAGGDVIVAMAWSGDVQGLLVPDQADDQDFQWALPKEGGMLWTDNMVIPKGAENKGQAELWINFYYTPENAATIEAWVNYVCPVKGAREVLLADDPDIGNNPLIFPTDAMTPLLHQFRAVTAEEEQSWGEAFSSVAGF
ncbi:MAG TPA: extracellular solute-binding protein [Candidatus Limnocylindria bacterium]|nr:extracellular solute-binding protein [Candidatus Limnocylindria bacterium]